MAPIAKTGSIVGVVLIFFGIIGMVLGANSEEVAEPYQYYNLVAYEKSGEFTTNYNSSFNLEVIVKTAFEDCENIELEIKDSSNVVVYDENMYCSQYETGERTTFNHVANETYTFQSSVFIDIWVNNDGDFYEESLFSFLGALSCCFGVILTSFFGIMATAMGNSQVVGMMPVQMGTSIPITTNAQNQGNVQMTQTYLTQPTIVQESIPQPVTIVNNEVRQQEESQEFKPTQEKKSNFWDNVE
ncbi:MAG: hypothetical protein CMA45_00485 [Euryarchaeota archaeon]|nr:hypothetical protein [Euryarchaeota archaeon]